jgi:hypothetical protein
VGGSGRAAGAGWNEEIADGREHADEPLQVPGRSRALHHPLSPTERQMRILRTVLFCSAKPRRIRMVFPILRRFGTVMSSWLIWRPTLKVTALI